ncbi:MAG TPA: restriction endonuclease [Terriglobales bacterium]|nr:restriction endonuclease [Terriglobales bacterium]
MRPLLVLASDGREHLLSDARETLAETFKLTEEEKKALLPSGRQAKFGNRVAWAKVYLTRARALDTPKRGSFRITERGRELLRDVPERITIKELMDRFPEIVEFRSPRQQKETAAGLEADDEGQTPEELLEDAYQRFRTDIASELLAHVTAASSHFFERLVVELLLSMGYGGSRKEAGEAIGRAGDEGIDGIINEDRLGLDVIYIQAKKWEGSVGRPEIQKFVGALHGKRAKKGVFITTSTFSSEAIDYVARIEPKVVLIDGQMLANLMIDFNVGVTPVTSYETKRIDSDYFSEE